MSPNSPVQIPEVVYKGLCRDNIINPCIEKVKSIINDDSLTNDDKSVLISFEVRSTLQPIVQMIKDRESLEYDPHNSPYLVDIKDLYERIVSKYGNVSDSI